MVAVIVVEVAVIIVGRIVVAVDGFRNVLSLVQKWFLFVISCHGR